MNANTAAGKTRSRGKQSVYRYTLYALMAALICIFAPIAVPIGPIPISLTNLVLYFAVFILGTRGTAVSYIVYLLIGAVGFPVFSGYEGGLGKIVGPTGGYLLGFIPMILVMGVCCKAVRGLSVKKNAALTITGMFLATVLAYVLGTAWFVFQMQCGWVYALSVCVFPFIPFDIAKIVIANFLGRKVRAPLAAQGFIE